MAATLKLPQVRPERGPTPYLNPGDTRGAFGEAEADTLARGGQALGQAAEAADQYVREQFAAQERIRKRTEAANGQIHESALETNLFDLQRQAEADNVFADPAKTKDYNASLHQAAEAAVEQYRKLGTHVEDQIFFKHRADAIVHRYSLQGTNLATNAQRTNHSTKLSQEADKWAAFVADNLAVRNPDGTFDFSAYDDARAELERYARHRYIGGATPEMEAKDLPAARQKLAKAFVDAHLLTQDFEAIEKKMADPEFVKDLGDAAPAYRVKVRQTANAFNIKLTEMRAEQTIRIALGKELGLKGDKLASYVARMDLTGKLTPTEKALNALHGYATASGKQPTADMIAKAFEVYVKPGAESSRFGNSLQGKAFAFLEDHAQAFREGTLSREDAHLFITMAGIADQKDALGNKRDLPITIRYALEERGIPSANITGPAGVAALASVLEQFPSQTEVSETQALEDVEQQLTQATPQLAETLKTLEPGVSDAQPSGSRALQVLAQTGINFYRDAEMLTGPESSVRAFFSNIPWVGRFMRSPGWVQRRQSFALLRPMIVDILRRNDRFSEKERQDLHTALHKFESQFFSEFTNLQDAIFGVDNSLAVLQARAEDTLMQEGSVGQKRMNELKQDLDNIILVRKMFGAPPIIFAKTPEEYVRAVRRLGLKVGDKFRYANMGNAVVIIRSIPELAEPETGQK